MKRDLTAAFDAAADTFERWRPLPGEVPAAIRAAIGAVTQLPSPARVLDLGAGTGRIGRAFVAAGDLYVGVDASLAMLRRFLGSIQGGFLLQADGRRLPLCDHAFDIVLLMQVLSGANDWLPLLKEVRRVVRPGGCVVVGHIVRPALGIDTQLKHRLKVILEQMRAPWRSPQDSRRQALGWMESSAARSVHAAAASWAVNATARDFLERHRTGARFAALPVSIQEQALAKLRAWAETTFGSIDAGFQETRSFELDIYEL